MTTQPDKVPVDGGDLAAVNGALSFSTQLCIESMTHPDPKHRRGIDFGALDRALVAAEALAAAHGADTPLPGGGVLRGVSAAGLLTRVRDVAARAAPYRPKERRA